MKFKMMMHVGGVACWNNYFPKIASAHVHHAVVVSKLNGKEGGSWADGEEGIEGRGRVGDEHRGK